MGSGPRNAPLVSGGWEQHSILWREVRCKLWEWPAYRHPDDECPYPAGCYAAERWHKERRSSETARGLELYEALLAASKASLTPEGPARHGAFKTRRTSPPLV